MWTTVRAFSAAFAAFFLFGAYQEYEARHAETDDVYLTRVIAAYFVERPNPANMPSRSAVATYWCDGNPVAEYSFDTGGLVSSLPVGPPSSKETLSDLEIVAMITGLSAADVISKIRAGEGFKKEQVIAAIFGALSGYRIGHWALHRRIPPCDSEQIARRLADPHFGSQLSRAIVQVYLHRRSIVAKGQLLPIDFDSNLGAIEHIALLGPDIGTPYISPETGQEAVAPIGGPTTGHQIVAMCQEIRLLSGRLAGDKYVASGKDHYIAIVYPSLIFQWLSHHSQLAAQAFPGYQGFSRFDDTLDPYETGLDLVKMRTGKWIVQSTFILAVVVGACGVIVLALWGWRYIYRSSD
jgi:hypothetical protein